jgi:hypothetical protein
MFQTRRMVKFNKVFKFMLVTLAKYYVNVNYMM